MCVGFRPAGVKDVCPAHAYMHVRARGARYSALRMGQASVCVGTENQFSLVGKNELATSPGSNDVQIEKAHRIVVEAGGLACFIYLLYLP